LPPCPSEGFFDHPGDPEAASLLAAFFTSQISTFTISATENSLSQDYPATIGGDVISLSIPYGHQPHGYVETSPFLNSSYFPNLSVASFHSSTTLMQNPVYNWILDISNASVGGISGKGNPYNAKCVSGP